MSAKAHSPEVRRRPEGRRVTLTIALPSSLRAALQEIATDECSYVGSIIRRAAQFEVARVQRAWERRGRRERDA